MARKDYIEKITQNLEHLTKDELKDVSILTTSQLGVRLKVMLVGLILSVIGLI